PQCEAELLEPMMELEIEIPEEFQGSVASDICQHRGLIMSSETSTFQSLIMTATAPLAELFDYANRLRSMTQGKGCFNMQPSHYRSVPVSVASKK
ncbi:MAG: elongation factor G, partial [Planctomycetota bacterium]